MSPVGLWLLAILAGCEWNVLLVSSGCGLVCLLIGGCTKRIILNAVFDVAGILLLVLSVLISVRASDDRSATMVSSIPFVLAAVVKSFHIARANAYRESEKLSLAEVFLYMAWLSAALAVIAYMYGAYFV